MSKECSELVMPGAHFQDHRCRNPATVYEHGQWRCKRHSEAGLKRARRKAAARRRDRKVAT